MRRFAPILLPIFLVACASTPIPLQKVYLSKPPRGLVRDQNNGEVVPYEKSSGYFCMEPEDFWFLLEKFNQRNRPKAPPVSH